MTTLILRPDLGRKAYRLRCRFRVEAFPHAGWLEGAKYAAAEMFVKDMAKQGYEYLDEHGFKMTGPFPCLDVITLPKRSEMAKWHTPSREMLPGLMAGKKYRTSASPFVMTAPNLAETDEWEYELAGVFVHKTILMETPSEDEQRKVLANR